MLAFFVNVFFFPFLWGSANILASARDAPSILPAGAVGTSAPVRPSKYMDPISGTATLEPALALEQRLYFGEHQVPLWNPDVAFGAPLAADMVSQPFYPLAILASLHPSPTTFAWFVAVRLFAAGFLTFLFLRFFVPFVPAVFGAVAFAFTGYFILYLTICHVSVEVLIGALFYGAEWLLRTRSWRAMVWIAAAVWLVMLGGMPESALLAVGLSAAYFAFRLLSEPRLRASWPQLLGRYAGANLAGVGAAAFLLLPFVEYLGNSFNTHQFARGGAFRGLRDVD
ncbi:MAG: hypothetical protein M3N82_13790, partial [Pseudomonadota bacterium]|nr:hypothetical protein [Pseudomonadota bacterium]